jgi:putative salt-induced outer membrane protein
MRRELALLALLQSMAPVVAMAQQAALPEAVTTMLRKAAGRDLKEETSRYLDAAVAIAADSYPESRDAIMAEVQRLTPARADQLAAIISGKASAGDIPPEKQVAADEKSVPPASKEAEKAAPPKPPGLLPVDNWKGGVELGAAMNTGNVSARSVATAVNMINDRDTWRHKVGATFGMIKTDGVTTKEAATANYQLDYKWTPRLYNYGLFDYSHDRYGTFRERYLETLGVGYRVLQGKTYSLDVEGGAAIRQSLPSDTMIRTDEYGGRVNTIFNWSISPTFAINNTGSAFVTDARTSLENTVALKTKITSTISGKLSFNLKHDTDVPMDSVRTSTETKATLLYSF